MDEKQTTQFEVIRQGKINESESITEYWLHHSNVDTWQFWLLLALFLVPLIILFWKMDRTKALLLGFFGLNVHVWFSYFDTFGVEHGMWGYPFKFVPFLPESVTLDTSLVPVSFMLIYQWCLQRQRKFIWFGIGLCAAYSFLLKPIMVQSELFLMYRGMNFVYLFLFYLAVFFIALGITNLFVALLNNSNKHGSSSSVRAYINKSYFQRKYGSKSKA